MTGDDRSRQVEGALGRQIAGPVLDVLRGMPEAVRSVRAVAFESLRRGETIDAASIAARSGRPESEIGEALRRMASVGAAKLDPSGLVVGVHGLSVAPTRHQLVLDGVALFTWCAIDAIGIPAGLGAQALVHTPCPECGRMITVAVRAGHAKVEGEPLAWCPSTTCTNLADGLCQELNLFCGRNHLEAWRARSGYPEALVLSIGEVEDNGRRVWGLGADDLLDRGQPSPERD